MSMSQRERVLALGVGVVASLFAGQVIWSSIEGGFQEKRNQIAALKKQKEDQGLQLLQGSESSKKINKILPRSASTKEEIARATYQSWLIYLAKQINLNEPLPRAMGDTVDKGGFHTYRFQLTGTGNLSHVTNLLKEFEAKPFLHRITRFEIRPSTNPNDGDKIAISMDCELLSLPMAKEIQSIPKSSYDLLAKSSADYEGSILNRNLFGPINQPPQLSPKRTVEATKGVRVDCTIDAKDPDLTHYLTYEIIGDAPADLKLDPETGKVDWTGRELGSVSFLVRATDSGIPAKSAEQLVTIQVKDLPPPAKAPPSFDVASQARISGLVANKDRAEGWIYSKTEGKTIKLRKGDELKLGSVVGKVIEVGVNYMELESEGRRWTLGIEETVADAYQRGQVD